MAEQAAAEATVAERIITACALRGATIAIAESLTGGLLVAELVSVPGASAVVRGGVVAYDTAIKHSVLGVEASLLAIRGPVDPTVAMEMALGARRVLAVNGVSATIGVSTTGVAGPDAQGGREVGTAIIGIAVEGRTDYRELLLDGDRDGIRRAVVSESLLEIERIIATL